MNRIEDVILANSSEIKAKLYQPAKKAFESPDTGINIVKPAAYRVIKDCAETTLLFLPIEIFIKFKSPVQALKGKFTRDAVIDLYNRTTTDAVAKILFQLIVDTCPKSVPQLSTVNPANIGNSNTDDPYGEYEYGNSHAVQESKSSVEIICSTYC
jgi:hypothetical protein